MSETAADALYRELAQLRKGRGAQSPRVASVLGPALRRLCGITRLDSPVLVRDKLQAHLNVLLDDLPPDLRIAAAAAFGLRSDAPPSLDKRTGQLAAELHMSRRTAMRRIDQASLSLAEVASAQLASSQSPDAAGARYVVDELRALLRLDRPAAEVIEERKIIATRGPVDHASCAVGLPRGEKDVDVDILFGGRLRTSESWPTGLLRYTVEFPSPLEQGASHSYAVALRVPADRPLAPHFVVQPAASLGAFKLRVRFDPAHQPGRVWRVDGALHREIDVREASPEPLRPDRVGEIQVAFQNVRAGLAYGAAWSWTDEEDGAMGLGLESH